MSEKNFKVGQVWKTRSMGTATVIGIAPDADAGNYPVLVETALGERLSLTLEGKFFHLNDHPGDLMELIEGERLAEPPRLVSGEHVHYSGIMASGADTVADAVSGPTEYKPETVCAGETHADRVVALGEGCAITITPGQALDDITNILAQLDSFQQRQSVVAYLQHFYGAQ